jgi:glycosyltransferase involved in cell wall biosynthesis
MLSVLIPVKDWNPLCLVESLSVQLIRSGIPYEILVSDDSNPDASLKISAAAGQMPGVRYFCRDTPLGRSTNRNFLGDQARFEFLLFVDGDAGIAGDNFIRNYLDSISPDQVLCGGTLYTDEPPEKQAYLLRWKYGRAREQSDAAARQKRSWKSFSTFNFLIPSEVFHKIRMDESIKGYGHEDTVFGIHLHQSGIKIKHLNNGLLHLGLEPAEVYLEKIRESGANLHQLYSKNAFPREYVGDIRLLALWRRMNRFGVTRFLGAWYKFRRKSLETRLCGPEPSLLLLDLYKLGAISQID